MIFTSIAGVLDETFYNLISADVISRDSIIVIILVKYEANVKMCEVNCTISSAIIVYV